jgi:hypothetical protein
MKVLSENIRLQRNRPSKRNKPRSNRHRLNIYNNRLGVIRKAVGRLKNLATAQQYANITRLMAMRCSAGKEADNTIWVTN